MNIPKIIVTLLLICIFTFNSKSCGPFEWEPDFSTYAFMYPDQKLFSIYTETMMLGKNDEIYHFSEIGNEKNRSEWMNYFSGKVEEKDIQTMLENTSIENLQNVLGYVKDNQDLKVAQNSVITYCKARNDLSFLNYLVYAKKCEPIATQGENVEIASLEYPYKDLLAEGEAKYKAENSPFLKLRYAYQLVRIARYVGDYEKAISYYEALAAPLAQVASEIQFKLLDQKAGAMAKSGKKAEANVLFGLIFDRCPSLRYSAFQSLQIQDQAEWKETMEKANTVREKTTLYFMRALKPNSQVLEEMNHIYLLNPSSDQLEILLIREINRLEYDLLKADLNQNIMFFQEYKAFPLEQALEYLKKVREFVMTVLIDKRSANLDFWKLNLAYLDYLSNFKTESKAALNQLILNSKSTHVKYMAQVILWIVELSEVQKVDRETESKFFQRMMAFKEEYETKKNSYEKSPQQIHYEQLLDYLSGVFHRLYNPKTEAAKYYLSDTRFTIWKAQINPPSIEILDAMITLFQEKDKNEFEKYLLSKLNAEAGYVYDESLNTDPSVQKSFLYNTKGMLLLSKNMPKEASEAFRQVEKPTFLRLDRSEPDPEMNPFTVNGVICDLCEDEQFKRGRYNRQALADQLYALQQKAAQSQKAERIKYYLMLGNFYYNLSHYGKYRLAQDYYISWVYQYIVWIGADNVEYTNLGYALEAYQKALDTALKIKDKEAAAKITFMLAVCEAAEEEKNKKDNFKILKEQYKDTEYFKFLINECSYFNTFVEGK